MHHGVHLGKALLQQPVEAGLGTVAPGSKHAHGCSGAPVAVAVAQPIVTGNVRVDEAMRTAFETYDVDASGTLTKDEAKQMVTEAAEARGVALEM